MMMKYDELRIHKTGKKSNIYTTKRPNHENRMTQQMDTNTIPTRIGTWMDMVTEWTGHRSGRNQDKGYMEFSSQGVFSPPSSSSSISCYFF